MPQTLATIRGKIQVNLLEDISSGYWASAELNTAIAMAGVMVAGDILWDIKTSLLKLRRNKTFYLSPFDMLVPLRLRDTSNVGGTTTNIVPPGMVVEMENDNPAWRIVAATTPLKHIYRSVYYLMLYPPPSSSYEGKRVTLEYVPIPPVLSADTDVFDGPMAAAECVAELATVFALLKYDVEKAFLRYQVYLKRASNFRADYDRDQIFETLKMRPGGRFTKQHHSLGFKRLFPFGAGVHN